MSGDEKSENSSPEDEAESLQNEVQAVRANLGELVSELDHRRHEAMNVPLQVRRHAKALSIAGLVVIGLVAGGITLSIQRARRRRRFLARVGAAVASARQSIGSKSDPAKDKPRVPERIATAAASAIVSVVARRLVQRLTSRREQAPL